MVGETRLWAQTGKRCLSCTCSEVCNLVGKENADVVRNSDSISILETETENVVGAIKGASKDMTKIPYEGSRHEAEADEGDKSRSKQKKVGRSLLGDRMSHLSGDETILVVWVTEGMNFTQGEQRTNRTTEVDIVNMLVTTKTPPWRRA